MTAARVVFAGTPAFALASLGALLGAGVRPIAVCTQPDRPAGRGRRRAPSPVKIRAEAEGIPVLEPQALTDAATQSSLASLEPDVVVVAAYGLLLPRAILDIPRAGCVNVHASLLPRWRGASPIQAAILAGDAETGISLMRMDAGLDSGPVFVREALAIGAEETAGELGERLAALGGELLVRSLPSILDGALEPEAQDEGRVTHAAKFGSPDAILDWSRPAIELARRVRAFNPVPGARFDLDGTAIKVWRARAVDGDGGPGTVIGDDASGPSIACGEGALRLEEVQRPGKRRTSGAELARQGRLPARIGGAARRR